MISHEIIGDDMQAVVLTMTSGDEVRAEAVWIQTLPFSRLADRSSPRTAEIART